MGTMLDKMMNQISQKAGAKGKIFDLGYGSTASFRFLHDEPIEIVMHERWIEGAQPGSKEMDLGYKIPCPKQYGYLNCPFCDMDEEAKNNKKTGRYTVSKWCFVGFDYRVSEVRTIFAAATKKSILKKIGDKLADLETLLECDFKIRRSESQAFGGDYDVTNSMKSSKFDPELDKIVAATIKGYRDNKGHVDQRALIIYAKKIVAGAFYEDLLDSANLKARSIEIPEKYYKDDIREEETQEASNQVDDADALLPVEDETDTDDFAVLDDLADEEEGEVEAV